MSVQMQYAWGGNAREPVTVIYEDGRRVASFDSEDEAIAWIREEYGDDVAVNVEIK